MKHYNANKIIPVKNPNRKLFGFHWLILLLMFMLSLWSSYLPSCSDLCLCPGWGASRASLRSARSAPAFIDCGIHIRLHVGIHVRVRGGAPREPRFARLARRPFSLWNLHASSCLHLCVCQGWGASQTSLRLARPAPAFIVEFILVFVFVFMFASGVGRLASLASLGSLSALFHCGRERKKTWKKERKNKMKEWRKK